MKNAIDLLIQLDVARRPARLRFRERENADEALKSIAAQMAGGPLNVTVQSDSGSTLTVRANAVRSYYITLDQPLEYPELTERWREFLGKPLSGEGPSWGTSAALGEPLPPMRLITTESIVEWACGCEARQTFASTFHLHYLCAAHLKHLT